MNRISSRQLALSFIVTRLCAEMVIVPSELIKYGADRFWSILFAKLAVLLLYLPSALLVIRYKGDNFFTAAVRRNRIYGIILGFLFTVGLSAELVDTVLNLENYITDTLLKGITLIAGIVILTAAAYFGAVKGVSAITRTSVFALSFFAALIILIFVTSSGILETVYLYPAFIEDGSYFAQSLIAEISCNGEILIFAVLCRNIREKPNRTLYYLAVVFVLLEIINLLYNLVLGPYLDSVEYPLHIISSLSDIVIFQRLDGINAIAWLFSGIIKIALLLACANQLYTDAAKQNKGRLFLALYSLFILAVCWFVGLDRRIYDYFQSVMNSAVVIAAAGALIPLLVLITGKKREGAEKKT